MKKYNSTARTLVTFHIGRGGHFNNGGHLSFVDTDMTISSYTDDLFIHFENLYKLLNKVGDRENLRELLLGADTDSAQLARLVKWGLNPGKLVYVDHNGNEVGLDYDNDGTGRIEIDGQYNTTYVCRLEECNEAELQLIYEAFLPIDDIKDYCRKKLGIEEAV